MLEPQGGSRQWAATAVQADLIDTLGRDRVRTGDAARQVCGQDVLALVIPQGTQDVELAVQVARRRHVVLDARQTWPHVHEEALAAAIAVDLGALQRPFEIDIGRRLATVGVGVDAHALDRAARQARLCLRALPLWPDMTLGQMLATGDGGEIGLGEAPLLQDVVGAHVVTGAGRTLHFGATELFGLLAGASRGLPSPLSLLEGHTGRGVVVCAVTVRLHRAPWTAWLRADLPPDRTGVLRALAAARGVLETRHVDTVRVVEQGRTGSMALRVTSVRDATDLADLTTAVAARLGEAGLAVGAAEVDDRRVRLGQQAPAWPEPQPDAPQLELQAAWPDVVPLLDVSDALAARSGVACARAWSAGIDAVRLRLPAAVAAHPADLAHLLDAGAVPIDAAGRWRQVVRDRMTPAAKVVLTALHRALDPDGLIAPRAGLP